MSKPSTTFCWHRIEDHILKMSNINSEAKQAILASANRIYNRHRGDKKGQTQNK